MKIATPSRPPLTRLQKVSGVTSYLAVISWIAVVVAVTVEAAIGPGPPERPRPPTPAATAAPSTPAPTTAPPPRRAGWCAREPGPGSRGGAVVVARGGAARGPAASPRGRQGCR
jgi:hypothetical protein